MRLRRDPYVQLGLGLLVAGAIVLPTGYFVLRSTPYGALGMSLIILGAISLALSRSRPHIPPALSHILLETGLENTSALVEELGLRSRAIYLPSSLASGSPQALIPLATNGARPSLVGALPKRLVVRYGAGPEDVGLLVTTPGSRSLGLLAAPPGPSAHELEAALSSILVGITDLARGVRVVRNDPQVSVEVSGVHMSYEYERAWLYQCLGSPLASIIASVAAEALDCPVAVETEVRKGSKSTITLTLMK